MGRWPPTAIFYGPSGVGKFLVAKAVAQNLTCSRQMACGSCSSCLKVEREESEFLHMVRPDRGQVRVEQAREVVQFMYLKEPGARTSGLDG